MRETRVADATGFESLILPGYPELIDDLRAVFLSAPAEDAAASHLAAMLVVGEAARVLSQKEHRRRRRAAVGTSIGLGAALLAGAGAAGATGDLPDPVQRVFASIAEPFGVHLPDGGAVDVPQDGDAPGRGGENPGRADEAPGQQTAPGQSQDAPGLGGEDPGRSETAPGRSGRGEDNRPETPPGLEGGTPPSRAPNPQGSGDAGDAVDGGPGGGPALPETPAPDVAGPNPPKSPPGSPPDSTPATTAPGRAR